MLDIQSIYAAGPIEKGECLMQGTYNQNKDGDAAMTELLELAWTAPSCADVCGAKVQFFVTAAVAKDANFLQHSMTLEAAPDSCNCSTAGACLKQSRLR